MQRKTGILNHRGNAARGGFALIMAVFFMVIMATLMLAMLSATTDTTNRTTNDYLLEQAQLIAKSATEYAVLRVSGYDRTAANDCLQQVTVDYPASDLKAVVNISYYGLGAGCAGNGTSGDILTAESNGTMLMDVYVTSGTTLGLSEPIRYHRRTLQKL